ncbi:iron-containing redox enzyme family protein [Solimicrobium silvestre]|uniref:Cupin domain n=1 Tax=Solimicrobium silvestre TaxID=2099400 RepID=A0A2S9H2U0_9BURK|nr:iron-containing redox enzyme family protein [Solimicrobium silvestre]PRC94280.1 Cupin domain [Solimicrobium silvestre]
MTLLMETEAVTILQSTAPAGMSLMWNNWLQEDALQDLVQHPLLLALGRNEASLGVLKTLLVQHSHYSRNFTRYLCSLLGQLTEASDIMALLENLREEMGVDGMGDMTHAEMFQRTLRIVGVTPDEHAALPATTAMVQTMMGYCQSNDPLAGLAAMCLGAEAIVPLVYRPILQALQHFGYGKDATEFFRLHIEEDEDHAITMLNILRRLTLDKPERRELAIQIGRELIGKRVAMFDSIWNNVQNSSATPAASTLAPVNGTRFSSADFGNVPARLKVTMPERLKHPMVMQTNNAADQAFSSDRKHKVHIVDLPTNTISMTIGRLDVAESTRLHRHNYETVMYILAGSGYSVVGERRVPWQAGDAVYIPVWAAHQHVNTGDVECAYLACENAPLLQNLGGIALREELGALTT